MALSDDEICRIMESGRTPRFVRLDNAYRYYDGSIYDGRPGFFDDSETPLRDRAPCIVYPVVRNAVQSFTSMVFGKDKFPAITSGTSEDDSAFDPRFCLNESDSIDLDTGNRKLVEQSRLDVVCQQILETALATGTAVPVVSVVRGRIRVSQIDPKVCTPTFSEDEPETVTSLEVTYRYVTDDTWDAGERRFVKRCWQYRRVIDAQFDTVFVPVEIRREDDRPVPNEPKTRYKHGFGFCPVVWYKSMSPIADLASIDGNPIHWGLFSLIDAVNLTLSQRYRAAIYSGDPQVTEFGVVDDEFQAPMGRASESRQSSIDSSGWREPLQPKRSGRATKRRKGAGVVWRYESPDARVELLCLPAGALKELSDDAADNIKKLRESLGHVWIDPQDLTGSGYVSGKTLALIFAQQVAKCDRIREDFGRKCLLPILNLIYRVVLASGDGLYLAGAKKLRAVLARFQAQVGQDSGSTWFEPALRLQWGDYFPASDMDDATRVASVIQALTCPRPIITLATAVLSIKTIFPDIQDPEQYLAALLKEADERQANALANAQVAASAAAPKDTSQSDVKSPPPVAAKAPKARTKPVAIQEEANST